MTRNRWSPEHDLQALLDALTDEVLAAPAAEINSSLHAAGESPDEAVCDMRRLLADGAGVPRVAGLSSDHGGAWVLRAQ